MTPIEQAREALKPFAAMADELSNEPSWKGVLEHDHPLAGRVNVSDFRRAAEALASLSPSTPVDGVGAGRPVAWQWRAMEYGNPVTPWEDMQLGYHAGWLMLAKRNPAKYRIEQRPLYTAPLASPEAEARLRERVAKDVMSLLQAWAGEIGIEEPGFWGKLASRSVLAKRAAEARLAQAEGGPAVTGAIIDTVGEELFSRGHTKITKQDVRAALEAALHPQSAAGEEGKP